MGQRATVRAADYTFFYGKANKSPGDRIFCNHRMGVVLVTNRLE